MFGSLRRSPAYSALAVCAVLAGPIAGAQASNSTLRTTVASYNARIYKDETAVANGLAAYRGHNATPLVRALRHEVSDLRRLKGKLSGEAASTAKGATAKGKMVQGLGLIANAYAALATDVKRSSAANPVPRAKVMAAIKTDKKGRAELKSGLTLLG